MKKEIGFCVVMLLFGSVDSVGAKHKQQAEKSKERCFNKNTAAKLKKAQEAAGNSVPPKIDRKKPTKKKKK